jgi:hypothetical protein
VTTESRQPVSHEWRRHSLVKVRRPAWSGHGSDASAAKDTPAQVVNTTSQAAVSHTTYNDIAW